ESACDAVFWSCISRHFLSEKVVSVAAVKPKIIAGGLIFIKGKRLFYQDVSQPLQNRAFSAMILALMDYKDFPYWVLAYYHVCPVADPQMEVARHKEFFCGRDITCRIYLSEQG